MYSFVVRGPPRLTLVPEKLDQAHRPGVCNCFIVFVLGLALAPFETDVPIKKLFPSDVRLGEQSFERCSRAGSVSLEVSLQANLSFVLSFDCACFAH